MRRGPRMCALALAVLSICASSIPAQSVAENKPVGRPGATKIDTAYAEFTEYGFYPKRLELKPGRVMLVVRNLASQKNVNFRLERIGAGALRESSLDGQKTRVREVLDLSAGDYTLQAVNGKGGVLEIRVR